MMHYLMLLNFSIYDYNKTEGYDYYMLDMARFTRHMDGYAIHINHIMTLLLLLFFFKLYTL